MRVNRQVAVRYVKGRRVVKQRLWRTFGGKPEGVAGRFKKWGIIEEYHEADKIMCDFDDPKVKRGHKSHRTGKRHNSLPDPKGHDRSRKRVPSPPVQSLAHTLGLTVLWQRWDKTQHGWHLIVKIRQRLTLAESIAAALILGDDKDRGRLNLARAISVRLHPSRFWQARANLLYRRKIT